MVLSRLTSGMESVETKASMAADEASLAAAVSSDVAAPHPRHPSSSAGVQSTTSVLSRAGGGTSGSAPLSSLSAAPSLLSEDRGNCSAPESSLGDVVASSTSLGGSVSRRSVQGVSF